MSDISNIKLPNGSTYGLKDSTARSKIDGLKVGGRNRILDTSDEYTQVTVGRNMGIVGNHMSLDSMGLSIGDVVTLSMWIKTSSNKHLRCRARVYDSSKNTIQDFIGDEYVCNEEKKVSCTFTIPNNVVYVLIMIDNNLTSVISDNTTEYYKELKLEKGNVATDWTPAPEDVENAISSAKEDAKNALNTANSKLDKDGTASKATADKNGKDITTTYAKLKQGNDFVHDGNEVSFISSAFKTASLYFNYKGVDGNTAKAITDYYFGSGQRSAPDTVYLHGTATKAVSDSNGNNIASTYLPKSGSDDAVTIGRQAINCANIHTNVTYDEFVIKTKIPFYNSASMPMIHIYGYNYNLSQIIDLRIVFYIWSDKFVNHTISSTTNYCPPVYLSSYTEDGNKYVAISIAYTMYFARFQVDMLDIWKDAGSRDYSKGWTISCQNKTGSTATIIPQDNIVSLSYSIIDKAKTASGVKVQVNGKETATTLVFDYGNSLSTTSYLAAWNETGKIQAISPGTLKVVMKLANVENKSSSTIRGELTSSDVVSALGYTPITSDNWKLNSRDKDGYVKSGYGYPNKMWATNVSGVPAWRDFPTNSTSTESGVFTMTYSEYPNSNISATDDSAKYYKIGRICYIYSSVTSITGNTGCVNGLPFSNYSAFSINCYYGQYANATSRCTQYMGMATSFGIHSSTASSVNAYAPLIISGWILLNE